MLIALEMGEVEGATLTPIKLRYTGRVIDLVHAFDTQNVIHTEPIEFNKQYMETTVGRVILNDHLPEEMPRTLTAFSRRKDSHSSFSTAICASDCTSRSRCSTK